MIRIAGQIMRKWCYEDNLAQGKEAHWDVRTLFDGEGVKEGYVVDLDIVQDPLWKIRCLFGVVSVDDPFVVVRDVLGGLGKGSDKKGEVLSIGKVAPHPTSLPLPWWGDNWVGNSS